MKTIAIVGYSNSGKSTVAAAIVSEATRRGMRAAAIKVGHASDNPHGPLRDTDRLAAAGADPVVFRSPAGWQLQISRAPEDRDQPLRFPAWLSAALADVDLLVVEGRRVSGAALIQTVGADGQYKVAREDCDLVLENVPDNPLPARLMEMIADSDRSKGA